MKKILLCLCAVVMSLSIVGCSSNDDKKENKTEKEVLVHAFEEFKKLESVKAVSKYTGKSLSVSESEILKESPINQVSEYTTCIKNDSVYMQSHTKMKDNPISRINFSKIGEKEVNLHTAYEESDVENGFVKEGFVELVTVNETDMKIQLNELEYYKDFLSVKYENVFSLSSKEEKSNTIITMDLKNNEKYDEINTEMIRKTNPMYDPLIFNGLKVEKRETSVYQMNFKLDEKNNIVSMNYKLKVDLGNNLSTEANAEIKYSNFNEAKLDTKYLDTIFDEVENDIIKEASKIEFKNIKAISKK